MAISTQLAETAIKVVLQGWEAAKRNLQSLNSMKLDDKTFKVKTSKETVEEPSKKKKAEKPEDIGKSLADKTKNPDVKSLLLKAIFNPLYAPLAAIGVSLKAFSVVYGASAKIAQAAQSKKQEADKKGDSKPTTTSPKGKSPATSPTPPKVKAKSPATSKPSTSPTTAPVAPKKPKSNSHLKPIAPKPEPPIRFQSVKDRLEAGSTFGVKPVDSKPRPPMGRVIPKPARPVGRPVAPVAPKAGGAAGGVLDAVKGLPGILTKIPAPLAAAGAAMAAIGVAMAAFAVAAAGAAKTVQTISSLLKSADPVRFEMVEQRFEVLNIIIGKQFIPLLQLADTTLKKVADVLRTGLSGGGLSNFVKTLTVMLERVVNNLLPMFEKGVATVEKLFAEITPYAEKFGDVLEEAFTLEGEHLLSVFTAAASVLGTVLKVAMELGTILWDIFGGTVALSVKAYGEGLKEFAKIFEGLGEVITTTADVLRSGFQSLVNTIVDIVNQALYALNKAIEQINKGIAMLPKVVKRQMGFDKLDYFGYVPHADFSHKAKPKDPKAKEKYTNTPMLAPKIEMLGIEDVFKRAQAAAVVDPKLLLDQERNRKADITNDWLKGIFEHTVPTAMAEKTGG